MPLHSAHSSVLDYWRDTVAGASSNDVDEVGHPDMGRTWNAWAYRLRKRAVVDELRRIGALHRPISVFEAAYGVGFYLEMWRALGCSRVVGVDISERAHRACQERFREFDLRVGALQSLGLMADWEELQGKFDIVTAFDVLYHIVDDAPAAAALSALAGAVRPGGALLITEKAAGLREIYRESQIVTRRPLWWYTSVVEPLGLRLTSERPVFWSMDPPARTAANAVVSRGAWVVMRGCLKFLPRNGAAQQAVGRVVGGLGYAVDRVALASQYASHNLTLLTFERTIA